MFQQQPFLNQENPDCETCKSVVNKIKALIKAGASQEAILAAVRFIFTSEFRLQKIYNQGP